MKQFFSILCAATLLASCTKNDAPVQPDVVQDDKLAADGFNFITSKKIALNVQLLTSDNKPLQNVLVNVSATDDPDNVLFSTLTDANGSINTSVTIPARIDSLVIDPAYVGLMRNAVAVINNNAVKATIGGAEGFSGDIIATEPIARMAGQVNTQKTAGTLGTTVVSYLGAYDNTGKPTNLAKADVVSQDLLSFINASLPEGKSVKNHHPAYLSANAETRLHIKKLSDVWITFVHEGTNFKNTLGFYSYPTNKQPHSVSDISEIKLAIPNASYLGSGGSFKSGEKVYLGRFPDNTTVDLVLLQNAWDGTKQKVNPSATMYFADDNMNNEKANSKRHAALLHDTKTDLFLYGFEDTQRDNGKSDEDFNDLVLYATTNPVESISSTAVEQIVTKITDTDGDGIEDAKDEFPNDATRAYTQYFPSQTAWGTLAFEDNWPYTGDYDLNDLVVRYQYAMVMNAKNNVVEMKGSYMVKAVGAAMKNGFGVQLPVAPNKISSITGQRRTGNYITTNSNGTEAGQSNAVFFPFDNAFKMFPTAPEGIINAYSFGNSYKSDTVNLKISFASPLTTTELGVAPFNPFLVANQVRSHEVHLPGNKPTDKFDSKLFGTGKDNSKPAQNRYFLTADNWPWALSFVESFDYPTEGSKVSKAYTYFLNWAKSNGTQYTDWYTNKAGYRNSSLIYKK